MSYHTDHLAWQQRVNQELNAANRFTDQNILSNPLLQKLLTGLSHPPQDLRSSVGFSVGHSNPSGMRHQEVLAGSKDNFIIQPSGSAHGLRQVTPTRSTKSFHHQPHHPPGPKPYVRGTEMYDYIRNKYRPLSASKKKSSRYGAQTQEKAAAAQMLKSNPMRASYEDSFKKRAQQIPYPFHPRPMSAAMAAKRRQLYTVQQEQDKPQRFNEDWQKACSQGTKSVYSKKTISENATPAHRDNSPFTQQKQNRSFQKTPTTARDKIMKQLYHLPDSELERLSQVLRINQSAQGDDLRAVSSDEKNIRRMAGSKSAIMTKENLEKFNQEGEEKDLTQIHGSEEAGEEKGDLVEELKTETRPKSKKGERSVIVSESRISIGKSTYTYLNSLEQRLEEEKRARQMLEKELESIKKELSTTARSRKN